MESKNAYVKEAFALLEQVNSAITKEYESLLNHELTPKQLLLLRTVRDEQKITVNFLSEKLSLSPSSLSQLISRLEVANYLEREVNVNNRREVFVMLGEKGVALFQNYDDIDQDIINKYYSEFTLEEVMTFRNLVKKLHSVIGKRGEGNE
ncbi:MarR family winged helix-turn-helix transcriptional regulator [Bacillus sp. CGMCC 1.16607]|uniref:MarR family winged helix-turn-helix transcriptional regulator n=1 Tax=Bacillus sp. CGMCC 1.16607 TaxID=3351842 RepID=UPI003629934E